MKKGFKSIISIISIIMLTLVLSFSFSSKAYAYSENMKYFDFEQTVLKMDAGTTRELRVVSYYDYTYYLGPHTSTATYMECSFKSGTEKVVLHIGPDETVKNVFFYFYVDDKRVGTTEEFASIEVYVQKIDSETVKNAQAHQAAIDALKNYKGNTAEFNAMYYYYNYKDLQNAFGPDGDKLLNHYNTYGKNEHRVANRRL